MLHFQFSCVLYAENYGNSDHLQVKVKFHLTSLILVGLKLAQTHSNRF